MICKVVIMNHSKFEIIITDYSEKSSILTKKS